MRRFAPAPRRNSLVRLVSGITIAVGIALTSISAQIPGRNVNMVSGTSWPEGDPFLQRQNEPSVAASTRNPLHLLGGSNDYRTVDVPGLPDGKETGDAWLGLFKSLDGGQRWTSTLLPGYPQDQSPAGNASPLKPYQAGADAVVRAGTHGLIYYSGLVFDRSDDGKSGVFLARFIDNNNLEAGDPFAYLGTTMVAQSPAGAAFLDKPWMAVDIPRGNPTMCTVGEGDLIPTAANGTLRKFGSTSKKANKKGSAANPQQIPAGAVYVTYTAITGEGTNLYSQIYIVRSTDCGKTWGAPIRVTRAEDQLNQGSNIAIDPRNGNVYVAWRRFDPNLKDSNDLDAMMIARVPFNNKKADTATVVKKFPKPKNIVNRDPRMLFEHREEEREREANPTAVEEEIEQFDLDDRDSFGFRSLAYPTLAIDATGRVYIAWTQRGFRADAVTPSGAPAGARIVITTTPDGKTFSPLRAVDDHSEPGRGHQLMPTMTFAGGKLIIVYYDMRETRAVSATGAPVHNRKATDANLVIRHTIDIRSVMAPAGDSPVFGVSTKVSDYLMGVNPRTGRVEDLQVNPPNLPMFKKGTSPFIGDYIDVTAAPAFIPQPNGKWIYNVNDTGIAPVFHAVWTDNRDVRPPANGDWTQYTPAKITQSSTTRTSLFDGSIVPQCTTAQSGNAGSRNQNLYTSRITPDGLLAGSPGNAKPLSAELQRGFVVFAQNMNASARAYRMTILSQPAGGRASFSQFPLPPYTAASAPPDSAIEMMVPARSTAARTVYVTSSNPDATIRINISEIDTTGLTVAEYPAAPEKIDGADTIVLLNPDIENPDIENPDIENPDIENPDIENAEVYNPDIENPDIENPDIENPDIENPDIENPDIENPDIENPDIENPDIENVRVANPDIENTTIANPDIENPDIENPDIENPDIENPDIENSAIADITWKVTNTGNTTASFNVNVFLAQQALPLGVHTQLILIKTYRTPVARPRDCQLGFQTRNILLANIPNPVIVPPTGQVGDPNDPEETNATLWLAPGEEGRIVLRTIDDDTSNNLIIMKADGSTVSIDPAVAPQSGLAPAISSQAVGTLDGAAGETDSPLVTPTGGNLFFLQMPLQATTGMPLTPAVTVQVRDNRTGTPVAGASVTLSLDANAGDAALSGNLALSDLNGVAVFPALAVSKAGSYTLDASATLVDMVIASAASTPFTVSDPLVVATTSLPAGTAGLPYAHTLQSVGGGAGPRIWSVTSGALPSGLTLSASGVIAGTINPSARGTFVFDAKVMDASVPAQADVRSLSITVNGIADISLGLSDSPDPVNANSELTYTITVANAGPSTATQLEVVFTMSPSVTFVSGAAACAAPVNRVITCALGILPAATATPLVIVVRPEVAGTIEGTASAAAIESDPIANNAATESTMVRTPVEIAQPSAENRTVQSAVPFALTLSATGGLAPYTWSIVAGTLPGGLTLDTTLGTITGTTVTETAAAYTFSVRATDSLGSVATISICLTVRPSVASELSTQTLGPDLTLEQMVTTLLRGGENGSVAVSNIRLNGSPIVTGTYAGAGVFEGGAGILGINRGIILSSGAVGNAKGPNRSDATSTSLGTAGDQELTALARLSGTNPSVETYDATVLEFDFVPSGNKVSFRYVFGSEEYNEYVASQFNDAFGFFIDDHSGNRRNYALVPNTAEPVTINSINGGNPFGSIQARNAHLYRNNDLNDGGATINIEADGLTVVLTLTAEVTPGQLHTMKLAIADAGDSGYDSWVFLEAGSLRVIENCTNGIDDDGDGLVDGSDPDCTVCAVPEQPIGAAAMLDGFDGFLGGEAAARRRQPSWPARRRRLAMLATV